MKEERLYIVGYMASGKSTFGRALAEKTGWKFIDLDSEIEKKAGTKIPQLIAERGEAAFRELEGAALRQTASECKTVIACGGGTPCFRDNMEFMTLHGMTLWLIATPERIAERILEAGDTRPLVAGMEKPHLLDFVRKHLLQRQHHYCKASMRFSGERLEDKARIDESVEKFLDEFDFLRPEIKRHE